ncbi:MAG: M67 family metallopeptidase [Acidimicrobiales bacterium]
MLTLDRTAYLEILAEAWRVYPLEACGLLVGPAGTGMASTFYPVPNAAQSSRVFTLDSLGYMKAERVADEAGLEVIGILHSHTHTSAYPSPTDVAEATKPLVPPTWRWAIVSLAWGYPELRSFVIGAPTDSSPTGIAEEPVVLSD